MTEEFLGVGVLGLKGVWKDEVEEVVIVNVYSPCSLGGKETYGTISKIFVLGRGW